MRWKEIISEKLTQALPLRARVDSKIQKAAPLIPAASPVDPLASIVQQVGPMVGAAAQQSAQQAVAMDDQEDEKRIADLLSKKSQAPQESMTDRSRGRELIKKKYLDK